VDQGLSLEVQSKAGGIVLTETFSASTGTIQMTVTIQTTVLCGLTGNATPILSR